MINLDTNQFNGISGKAIENKMLAAKDGEIGVGVSLNSLTDKRSDLSDNTNKKESQEKEEVELEVKKTKVYRDSKHFLRRLWVL